MSDATTSRPARSRPRRLEGLRVDRVSGRHALFDARGDRVHLLNETAFALWQLCDGMTSPEEMAAGICDLFDEGAATVMADIDRALTELSERGLIEWAEGPQS